MATRPVLLKDLAVLVENAVQQAIEKHGGGPIDKLWVGFVAPDAIATEANAASIAKAISQETGVKVTPAVATQGIAAAGAVHTESLVKPGHLIGLVYDPHTIK